MGFSLSDIGQDALRQLVGTRAHNSGALAIGTTKTKVTVGADIKYSVDGIFCSKTAAADVFTLPSSETVISAGSAAPGVKQSSAFAGATRYFFLGLNAAGTAYAYISKAQPDAMATADNSLIPEFDAGVCIVGIVKVVAAAGTTFTPGTTNLDAAGITATYHNCSVLPNSLP